MGEDEFWKLTVPQLKALFRRFKDRKLVEQNIIGNLAQLNSMFYNTNRRKGSKSLKPEDFIVDDRPAKANILTTLKQVTISAGGEIVDGRPE